VLEFILEHAKVDKYNSLLAHVLVYKTYEKSRMVCPSCILGLGKPKKCTPAARRN